jgi:hypothetical protein
MMWLSFDAHPAIAHLSWKDRTQLVDSTLKRLRRQRSFWVEGTLSSLVCLSACVLLAVRLADRGQTFAWPMLALPCLVAAQVVWWFFRIRRLFGLVLRRRLLEEGIRPRVCLECGENLRGMLQEQCPACGVELTTDEWQEA